MVAAALAWATLSAPTTVVASDRQSSLGAGTFSASQSPTPGGLGAPDESAGVELPDILSQEDAVRYSAIFSHQKRGRWRTADREIGKLSDKVLMGHVLAQRYLHPTRYRSRFRELADWLARYADHPEANRIYRLALKRRPKSAARPKRPTAQPFPVYDDESAAASGYRSPRRRTSAQRRTVRRIMWRINRYAHIEYFTVGTRYLESAKVQRLLDQVESDISYARIGAGWFYYGKADKAYSLAGPAALRSGKHYPDGHWIAGLAAFHIGRYTEAATHFEAMAESEWLTSWSKAAAAFWAARANLVGERPDRVHGWLSAAADHPHTFYGLLAARILGQEITFEWNLPELTPELVEALLDRAAGRRALALIQIGRNGPAERELRQMDIARDPKLGPAVLAIADVARLPALSLRAARHVLDDGTPHYGALYPVPEWEPPGGYSIDRALVYAFMRQESGFNARAKSRAGARGLMQLMPATAGYMARKRFRGRRRNELYDPEYNITLGQKYLNYLLSHDTVEGNLLLLPAAYNGGPGNLSKWRRRAEQSRYEDPLLFIESIPAEETRNFVERVLANLWIYRARLGQPAPSLDLLAAGERPIYESQDGKTERVAFHVRDRR